MDAKSGILLEKRAEVKQFIDDGSVKTFPAYLFNLAGKALKRIFGLTKTPHWAIGSFVWFTLAYLPGMLVAVALGETSQWENIHRFYAGLLPFGYFAAVVCYVNVVYNLLPGIRDHIVDSIQTVEDLDKLKNWLVGFWSVRSWLRFMMVAGILIAIAFTVGVSQGVGSFVGFGLTLISFSVGPFFWGPLYIIFYMLTLPPQLATYQIKTYNLDPANSEVIQRLTSTFNIYLYELAGYLAVGTAFVSINPVANWWTWICVLIGWTPTVLQFLVNQYSVRKIIVNAKWIVLNQLQQQIIDLQNKDLGNSPEPTVGQINALMDLHDRIRAKPNSMLNWGTGLSFLNQLMLPLLGLVIGNFDKLVKVINP